MMFTTPIWLLGLLPWAGVTLYLLSGRRVQAVVPFLALWSGPAVVPKPRWAVHRPPLFVLLMIVSMLLAVLAAGGPAVRFGRSATPIEIILDRGITMSPVVDGEPFRGVVATATAELSRRFGSAVVNLVTVPGGVTRTDLSHLGSIARPLPPTAMDTQAAMEQAIAARLRDAVGPVLVLTDRKIEPVNDRVVQIAPAKAVEDVGIALVAARAEPTPQVMVRMRNQSQRKSVRLRIVSGQQQIEREVALSPAGQMRDEFIDMPGSLGETVAVEVDGNDVAPVNDRTWLVREGTSPVIEARSSLPPAVGRMIEVYSKLRPGGAGSKHIGVMDRALPGTASGLWIVPGNGGGSAVTEVSAHPVTANVGHWPGTADAAMNAPNGFSPIVSIGGRAAVAVRDDAVRQVWVNLELDAWSRQPDFVIFFSNVFDWLGGGSGPEYVAHDVGKLGEGWRRLDDSPAPAGVEAGLWPGVYRRRDGALRAVNAAEVRWGGSEQTNWRQRMDGVAVTSGGVMRLRPVFCLAGIALAAGAVGCWPRSARGVAAQVHP